MRPRVIAITGGIGAGKSVVSEILRCEGFSVYDCDLRAKKLMDCDLKMQRLLCREIHQEAVKDGVIDRKLIGNIVFADDDKLAALNKIVHEAVRRDLVDWIAERDGNGTVFVETAILYQSRLDRMVGEVWEVVAPIEVRVPRVMQRNSLSREDVVARIEAQDSFVPDKIHDTVRRIINDNIVPVLPQIKELISD